jgi:hypothetical protein
MIEKVVSGGQTGTDRAALDAALELGIPIGGYCTADRRAEDGPIPDRYPLTTLATNDYPSRTRANIQEATATLVLYAGPITSPGTRLTISLCKQKRNGDMWLGIELNEANAETVKFARDWLAFRRVRVLNVAGPRESKNPGIYQNAKAFLLAVLRSEEPR